MKLTKLETPPFVKVDTTVGTHVTINGITIFGDTGTRVLTSWDEEGNITYGELPSTIEPYPGYSGGIYIRRVGQRVRLSIISATTLSSGPTIPIPYGFRVLYAPFPYTNLNPIKSSGPVVAKVGAAMIYFSGFTIGDAMSDRSSSSYASNVVWDCTQSWPTSLPGIPA